jgi:uncharacterized protein YgbK (DUF1537 family)
MDRRLVVVADDLTGANDTAVQFAALGRAVTVLSLERLSEFGECPVVAVTTESRNLPAEEAARRLRETAARVRELESPAPLVYKKLDSSLRGRLGVEIDVLLDELGLDCALVAPAYPAQGRLTAGGYHLINQVPVGESDARRDPLTPVTESHLGRLLAAQSRCPVAHLDLETVMAGPAAVRGRLRQLAGSGARLIAADATTPAHLAALAEVAAAEPGVLPCGSAGLAWALAGILAAAGEDGRRAGDDLAAELSEEGRTGGVLVLCGSQTQAALRQVEAVRTERAAAVWTLDEAEQGAAEPAARELAAGRNVLVYVAPPAAGGEGSPGAARSWEEAARILTSLGELGRRLAPAARRLILTGGDTAMAVAGALGAAGLTLAGEVLPGVVAGRLRGLSGAVDGLPVVTKSGSFGDPQTLARLLAL